MGGNKDVKRNDDDDDDKEIGTRSLIFPYKLLINIIYSVKNSKKTKMLYFEHCKDSKHTQITTNCTTQNVIKMFLVCWTEVAE